MCGITGWVDWMKDLAHYPTIVESMTETLTPRGPDAKGTWLSTHCALGHRRLSVIDPENGAQPMSRKMGVKTYTLVYNGEIYNAAELRSELKCRGHRFHTMCDTEVLLLAYMEWGPSCVEKLNGIFAFAVWNDVDETLFMARDRLGVKPLFYSCRTGSLLFGSEPKAILAHPGFHPEADEETLAEIFAVGPARTPGHGIFKHMEELRPGHCLHYTRGGLRIHAYWKLESREHTDDLEKTVTAVRELLLDTVHRQLISDVPVCTLLSGGLDSSALTAIAAAHYRDSGRGALDTYSVDYADNDKHFKSSAFTPNADAPWIKRMSEHLGTRHTYVEFDTPELVDSLTEVVLARDTPGMADIDGSLLLFSREIKKGATVALSGEAADEIFGGYPWFHRNESLEADTFPWSLKLKERLSVLSPELLDYAQPEAYVKGRYEQALSEVSHLPSESPKLRTMREMSYLNITRFMPTLLDRKDRMSMRVGLEVRVPYCDHRLVDYVYNIPWEMKTSGNREKGILRKALEGILPEDVLYRKKSPYPKTHNPNYMKAVKAWMLDILDDPASPILPFINVPKLRELAAAESDSFDIPWFGQLMTGPQLFAYLAQVNFWLKEYRISVK
ncbi:asparagine synthase (glutamine-hydrolyzing) [Xylanibacillus composti]|uniref:asparagine synthase (glutamine-hydrolyzing) n=1 Tax=Xylanibacillus composti TaxID=1572762 RepID=A0A8J4M250_9BACL|nr:asparagine synthase (glutamine-hydrolyzing) [Xylanibacillus composti]MDT9723407.1 asparagine synthase (glutamine-hydrolyzing) [Xylanibacillus composti]GIQ68557.1 asparagine synthetase B [Xylanibacillus composti]